MSYIRPEEILDYLSTHPKSCWYNRPDIKKHILDFVEELNDSKGQEIYCDEPEISAFISDKGFRVRCKYMNPPNNLTDYSGWGWYMALGFYASRSKEPQLPTEFSKPVEKLQDSFKSDKTPNGLYKFFKRFR